MTSSLIIPERYEQILLIEAKKSGLVKNIDDDVVASNEFDNWMEKYYSRYYKSRQNLFQMILLYDDLIIPSADPTYDYSGLNERDNFSIYSFEDYCQYDPIHMESHPEYSHYLKPALMPELIKTLKEYFLYDDPKMRLARVVSDLYDVILGLKSELDEEVNDFLELNKIVFDIRHMQYFERMDILHAPSTINRNRYFTDITYWIICNYERLCWELEISTSKNAHIMNCEYKLAKIGYENFDTSINTYLETYKILRCELSKLIGTLPQLNSLDEVFKLKEQRKGDINNLKEVLNQLEYVLKNEGKERAIIKASHDVQKAAESLSKRNKIAPVGKWTTVFSVPISILEIIKGLPPIGLVLSAVGTGICLADEFFKKKGGWCEVVR